MSGAPKGRGTGRKSKSAAPNSDEAVEAQAPDSPDGASEAVVEETAEAGLRGADADIATEADTHADDSDDAEGDLHTADETELSASEHADGEQSTDAAVVSPALDREGLIASLESLIFVSDHIVTAVQLARALKIRPIVVRDLMMELMQRFEGRGIEIIEVAGGYQFRSAPRCAAVVREFVAQRPVRLTRAQLETLALVGYRQPITRPEIDEVRGVDSGSALRVLLERGLLKMLGRKDEAGRPLLYGTTPQFLEFFGMNSLRDLPTLREFTELSDENRALFKHRTGETVEAAEAELASAEEAAQRDGEPLAEFSDEDLAELAAQSEADDPAPSEFPPEQVALGEPPDLLDGVSSGIEGE